MHWTGGWQQSPSSLCPAGHYASSLLSPDGCVPCPRGTFSSTSADDALLSELQCQSCPAGKYNDRVGAVGDEGCTLCPMNTFGSATGLQSRLCSGRCAPGKYSLQLGLVLDSRCIPCPLGYNAGAGQCDVGRSVESPRMVRLSEKPPHIYERGRASTGQL